MFGLPTTTVAVIAGVALFWVVYTAVFAWRSRNWKNEDERSGR
ncbi:hypothetical protein GCM10027174_24000 [Salinifilum aidingensis]